MVTEAQQIQEIANKYCVGKGLDVGCGERKIVSNAIGVDFITQYDIKDHPKTQADFHGGWQQYFDTQKPENLDFIFSSHLIEDFDNAYEILDRWIEAMKPGGYITLYLPVEQKFKQHCYDTGQHYNPHHKQDWKGYEDFMSQLTNNKVSLVEGTDVSGTYSFYVVLKRG
jgi:predicted SAM-dependent methyltransferase